MISPELTAKYNNHCQKADQYDTQILTQLYDKYSTLYTAFNMLYNEIPGILRNRAIALRAVENETNKATSLVAQFLTEHTLFSAFQADRRLEDIDALAWVIEEGIFNIKLDPMGNPRKDADLILLAGLRSADHAVQVMAVLKVMYYVRCNLSHGSKDIQEYQRFLLEPLLNLLITVNGQLYNALNN